MHSFEQEQHIREEEKIRADERNKIIQREIDQRERELREESELAHLREVSQVHGLAAAYLMRMLPYLAVGVVVGLLMAIGEFTGTSQAGASFFGKLWAAIKDVGIGFGCAVLFGLWKCRNI